MRMLLQQHKQKLAPFLSRAHSTTTGGDGGQSEQSEQQSQTKARERIHQMVSKKPVFVFMKGVPEAPACGYSNAVVQILDAYGVKYDSFNVLKDDQIRQEVKSFSNWPTIPQVYVNGTFVGGCDILIQMHQNNELEQLFKGDNADHGGRGSGGGPNDVSKEK